MHPNLKRELEEKAGRVYRMALERVGIACPAWLDRKTRRQIFRVYVKAQIKNHFVSPKIGYTYHVDHIVPLKYKVKGKLVACGLHVPWNLHVLPSIINLAKGTMLVPEWLEGKDATATKQAFQERVETNRRAREAERERRRAIKLSKRRKRRTQQAEREQTEDDDLMNRFDYAINK